MLKAFWNWVVILVYHGHLSCSWYVTFAVTMTHQASRTWRASVSARSNFCFLHCCVYDPCPVSCMSSKPAFEQFNIASHLLFLFFFPVQMPFPAFLVFWFGHHHCSFWSVYIQFCGFSSNIEWLQLWVFGCPTSFIVGLCSLMNCCLLSILLLICHGSWGIVQQWISLLLILE